MKNKGFTLIELIVVITILAILGTIAFISFKGYTSDARDSKVTTDIANLHNSLALLKSTKGVLPVPDSAKTVTASGEKITFEGEVGNNVRSTIKASKDLQTPDGTNYMYAINGDRKDFTLVGFLEGDTSSFTKKASAEDEEKSMFFKGGDVLTLFDSSNNFVSDDIFAVDSGNVVYLGGEKMTVASNKVVMKSCLDIKRAGFGNSDGLYKITPDGTEIDAYCDMNTAGGGWTLLFRRKYGVNNVEDCGANLNEFMHGTCGTISADLTENTSYSMGIDLDNIEKKEYYFAQYEKGLEKDVNDSYIIRTDKNLFPDSLGLFEIPIEGICSSENKNCDVTDSYWKYTGNNHYNSSLCSGAVGLPYGGNYGYCQNGADKDLSVEYRYSSSGLFGDRSGYQETKLWGQYSKAEFFLETIFVR